MAGEGNFTNKLKDIFGFDNDYEFDDDEFDEEDEDETYISEDAVNNQTIVSNDTTTVINQTASPIPEKVPDVLVLDPTSFDEAPGIVNRLKQDRTIVVNLRSIDFEEGRKIFDFLSGAVYALEGSLNRIDESVFILAPRLISVGTTMESAKIKPANQETVSSWDNNN